MAYVNCVYRNISKKAQFICQFVFAAVLFLSHVKQSNEFFLLVCIQFLGMNLQK